MKYNSALRTEMETESISSTIAVALEKCGFPKSRISVLHQGTRIFHDLHIFGDDFEDLYIAIQEQKDYKLSKVPKKYIPGESSWIGFMCQITGFRIRVLTSMVPELTISMLERIFESGTEDKDLLGQISKAD